MDCEETGIGPAMIVRTAELHGVRAGGESPAGQGTTFRFALPSEPAEEERA